MNQQTAKQLSVLALQLKNLTKDRATFTADTPTTVTFNFPTSFIMLTEGNLKNVQEAVMKELDAQIESTQQAMKELLSL